MQTASRQCSSDLQSKATSQPWTTSSDRSSCWSGALAPGKTRAAAQRLRCMQPHMQQLPQLPHLKTPSPTAFTAVVCLCSGTKISVCNGHNEQRLSCHSSSQANLARQDLCNTYLAFVPEYVGVVAVIQHIDVRGHNGSSCIQKQSSNAAVQQHSTRTIWRRDQPAVQ